MIFDIQPELPPVLPRPNQRALVGIEAKRFSKNPNLAQEQAKKYAKSVDAPFIFLSNGDQMYASIIR